MTKLSRRILRLMTLGLALCVILPATVALAKETLLARILEPFETPSDLSLDPLNDNDETLAAVAVVEKALATKGIKIREDADYVLEIEVDPAANASLSSNWRDEAESRAYMDKQRQNPVNELAPSDDLAPEGMVRPKADRYASRPDLAVTFLLYKRGEPPVWMARAVAPRNQKSVDEQIRSLAALAMMRFAETATIGFKTDGKPDQP